ncbi:MAG: type I methionyl aminopeptidase [Candidatus Pacebacteria bacterium]|nr:type I methionyl aminopeptidase [Candidatus Paceibacterota bacterium]
MARQKINLKSKAEIEIMKEAGKIMADVLKLLGDKVAPGVYGDEIEEFAIKQIKKYGVVSSFKDYQICKEGVPFPSAVCFSVNDEIVHGFPFGKEIKEGDIVSIDFGIKYNGFHADSAITVGAGKISKTAEELISVTRESLYQGIKEVKIGNRMGDIGFAIQDYAEKNGFSVVRDLVGHGVGRSIHEPPEVPNFGKKGEGMKLCAGMTFAIEPMINVGNYHINCDNEDQWTIRTEDGKLSAHFEHTVAVTSEGCIVLTELK